MQESVILFAYHSHLETYSTYPHIQNETKKTKKPTQTLHYVPLKPQQVLMENRKQRGEGEGGEWHLLYQPDRSYQSVCLLRALSCHQIALDKSVTS